jgi:hypothetical protein
VLVCSARWPSGLADGVAHLYGTHRYSWDTYPLWIFDRLGAGNVYNPEQRFVPYLWVYTTRPDGQRLRAGDTFKTSTPLGQPWSEFVGTMFTASYYGDGTLLTQFLRQGGSSDSEAIFEFLWRDVRLQPKPLEDLPLSRYFGSPFGWMVARTGWGQNAVLAEMKVNEYNFVNHQHLDAGAFQIYYQGALAIDSGSYSGSSGKYGSPHCQNWVFGTNYANDIEPRQLERSSLEPGAWRIELSPKTAARENLFLTVMQVTDRTAPGRLPVRLFELRDRVGSCIERPDGNRLVLFRRDGQRSSQPVTVETSGPGTTGVLVTDLTPGAWRVRRAGESASRKIRVSQELAAAWFEAPPGNWHLEISTL